MKVKYITNCKAVFDYKIIFFNLSRNVGLRRFERFHSLKKELLVLNARANYFWPLFFCWN